MGGSSSSEEQKGFGYDTATHPPAGKCFKNGEPCERDKYDSADIIGGCCAGQRCNQVSFMDDSAPVHHRGAYFCFNQYTGEYDNTAADNACATSNFLGVAWCNKMETSVGDVCIDNDELVTQLSFGKVTSCEDAIKEWKEYGLSSCSEMNHHFQDAIRDGYVDPSVNVGNTHSLNDICCETCSSVGGVRVLGYSQNMTDSMFANDAGEIAILALAIVGVVAIFGKIFNACVQKKEYTEVADKTVEEET